MSSPARSSVWIDPAVYTYPASDAAAGTAPSQDNRHYGTRQGQSFPQPRKQPNPITPIPVRASAHHANSTYGAVTRKLGHNVPPIWGYEPATAPAHPGSASAGSKETQSGGPRGHAWEYESDNYAVGSSLPALSLLAPETPTQPHIDSPVKKTRRLPRIEEIDTVPPTLQTRERSQYAQPAIEEIDTAPDLYVRAGLLAQSSELALSSTSALAPASTRALVSLPHQVDVVESGSSSWTAGKAANSVQAQLIANRSKRKRQHRTLKLNPLDRVRWWLLHPGRLEFLLWLAGTLLLITVTCGLLLLTALSFNWFAPALPGGITASSNAVSSSPDSRVLPTITTTPGLSLTLLDKPPFLPDQTIHLHGQGFSSGGQVTFTYDSSKQPMLDRQGKSASTQVGAHGTFTVALLLNGSAWGPGYHLIVAHDLTTRHLAELEIVLAPGSFGKTAPATTTPAPGTTPGAKATATPGGTGSGAPTPVGQTPVPVTPTPPVGHTPTPAPSPTQVPSTPTPTSTVSTTPTPGGSNPPPTTTPGSSSPSDLGNAIGNSSDSSIGTRLTGLNPLVLLMIACYTLAFVLLGIAGMLYKRRH